MTLSAFDLTGKWALVTGANTGLGQAIALALAGAGANLVLVNRSSAAHTLAQVKAMGREAHEIKSDLSNTAGLEQVISRASDFTVRLDILVNNAGIIRRADALEFTENDWDDVMDVNLKNLLFLSQAFARRAVANGYAAKIINIASMLSYQGGKRVASYTASKSGVMGLTRSLANEWADKGVMVNAIAPGYFATNNTAALQADEVRNAEILGRIPAGRWGDPSDIGGAAIFLASDAAIYITGITLPVDGGWLAR